MLLSPYKKVPASVSDVICNQIWSPYLNWVSIEGKRFHISLWTDAAVHLIRTTSADYSAVLLQECVRELSWPNRPMNKEKKVFASSRRREFSRLQVHGSSHVIQSFNIEWDGSICLICPQLRSAFGSIQLPSMPHWQVWTLESLPVQKNSRISLFVIASTVGDPVKFQWSVATVVLSGRQLSHYWLLIGYVIRIRCA